MGDWSGPGSVAPGRTVYRPFEEVRAFVHNLGLKSAVNWYKYGKDERPRPPGTDLSRGLRPCPNSFLGYIGL